MKEFLNIMLNDILKEDFTRKELVVYSIIVPSVFMLVVGLVETIFKY